MRLRRLRRHILNIGGASMLRIDFIRKIDEALLGEGNADYVKELAIVWGNYCRVRDGRTLPHGYILVSEGENGEKLFKDTTTGDTYRRSRSGYVMRGEKSNELLRGKSGA